LLKRKENKQRDPLSPRRFPASAINPLFSSAYISMRCGSQIEPCGILLSLEAIDSYKIDYSEEHPEVSNGW
jgi:hypothetical protein